MRRAPYSKKLRPGYFGYSPRHPITILSGQDVKERREAYIYDIWNLLVAFENIDLHDTNWPVAGRDVQIIDDRGDRDFLRELTRAVRRQGASHIRVITEEPGDKFSDWNVLADIQSEVRDAAR